MKLNLMVLSTKYCNIRQMTAFSAKEMAIYAFAVITTLLLLFSVNTQSQYVTMLFIILFPIGILKPEYLIPAFFISSLSSNYFEAAQGIGYSRILSFVIIAGVLFRLLSSGNTMVRKNWNLYCLLIIITTLISFLLAYDDDISILYTVMYNILIFSAFTNLKISNNELIHLFRAIFFAVFITTIYIIVAIATNPEILFVGRLTIEDNVNENRFGMMMAQLGAYSIGYAYFSKNAYAKMICFILFFVNVFLVFLSSSRSSLLGIMIGTLLSILIVSYFRHKIFKVLIPLFVVVITLLATFNIILDSMPRLASRMTIEQGISSQLVEGGRWHRLVAEIHYVIPDHLFFGVGPGSENETIALTRYSIAEPGSSHNIILSLVSQLGIIGFMVYMSFFGKIFKDVIFKLRRQEMFIIPLVLIMTAFFNGVGEVIYSERWFWNALALAALCISKCPNNISQITSVRLNWQQQLSLKHNIYASITRQ